MSNFGEKLKFIRKTLNLNRPEFAHKVDINEATIRVWENSGTPMSKSNTEKLKKNLTKILRDADILWLFDEETPSLPHEKVYALSTAAIAYLKDQKEKAMARRFVYLIKEQSDMSLFKPHTKLLLEPTTLKSTQYPCLMVFEDADKKMHIGVVHQLPDQKHVMHIYHQHAYSMRVLDETHTLYVVINSIQEK